jgi:hypothetical protein
MVDPPIVQLPGAQHTYLRFPGARRERFSRKAIVRRSGVALPICLVPKTRRKRHAAVASRLLVAIGLTVRLGSPPRPLGCSPKLLKGCGVWRRNMGA